jgi:putative AlgH/UPF0301 family transcriptional regulator/uncharacterized protein YtpQ (UPF0354 family)
MWKSIKNLFTRKSKQDESIPEIIQPIIEPQSAPIIEDAKPEIVANQIAEVVQVEPKNVEIVVEKTIEIQPEIIETFADEKVDIVPEIIENIAEVKVDIVPEIIETIADEKVDIVPEIIETIADEKVDIVPEIIETITEEKVDIVPEILENITEEKVDIVPEILENIAEEKVDIVPEIIETITEEKVEIVPEILETITEEKVEIVPEIIENIAKENVENESEIISKTNLPTEKIIVPSGVDYFVSLKKVNPINIQDGDVIASKPYFGEAQFAEKLILIINVDDHNIVGIIINNQPDTVSKIAVNGKPQMCAIGGPVQTDLMVCVVYSAENGMEALITGEDKIQNFITEHQLNAENMKLSYGLVAWSVAQFNDEYNDTVWHICKNFKHSIQDWNSENLWNRIMDTHYKNDYKKILPKLKAINSNNQDGVTNTIEIPYNMQPILYPIADDLAIGFVHDIGENYLYINNSFLETNKTINPERLANQSIRTFVKDVAELIDIDETENGFFVVKANGQLESSIVLIDEFMNHLHTNMGNELMIGLPASHLFLIANAENTNHVAAMKQFMANYYKQETIHGALSKSMYKKVNGNPNLIKIWSC